MTTLADTLIAPLPRLADPAGLAAAAPIDDPTYRRLHDRSQLIADRLRRAGIGSGAVIALCVESVVDRLSAAMAIDKCGGRALVLDAAAPPGDLDCLDSGATPAAILTERALASDLPGWGLPVVLIDDDPDRVACRRVLHGGAPGVPLYWIDPPPSWCATAGAALADALPGPLITLGVEDPRDGDRLAAVIREAPASIVALAGMAAAAPLAVETASRLLADDLRVALVVLIDAAPARGHGWWRAPSRPIDTRGLIVSHSLADADKARSWRRRFALGADEAIVPSDPADAAPLGAAIARRLIRIPAN